MAGHLLRNFSANRKRSCSPNSTGSARTTLSSRTMPQTKEHLCSTIGTSTTLAESTLASPDSSSNRSEFITENTVCGGSPDDSRDESGSRVSDSKNELVSQLEKYNDTLASIFTPNHSGPGNDTDIGTGSSIVRVAPDELRKIQLLGTGKHCQVHLVTASLSQTGDRVGKAKYACKSIDPERVISVKDFLDAASDLASEAKMLSELDHRHIIKIRGLCSKPFSASFTDTVIPSVTRQGSYPKGTSTNGIDGFFLILDALKETLGDRLKRQRRAEAIEKASRKRAKNYNPFKKVPPCDMTAAVTNADRLALYERIKHVVVGIVSAMQYLHSRKIVLRDLKPANVGFADNEDVQLFDFGMTRPLAECSPDEACGSQLYMAPEIMNDGRYTLKGDVYSFGVLLFELCSLQAPYAKEKQMMIKKYQPPQPKSGLSVLFRKKYRSPDDGSNIRQKSAREVSMLVFDELSEKVGKHHLRPAEDLEELKALIPCERLCVLIQDCWSGEPEARPDFDQIQQRLNEIFAKQ